MAAQHLILLSVSEKVLEDDPSIWVPGTHVGNLDGAPGLQSDVPLSAKDKIGK